LAGVIFFYVFFEKTDEYYVPMYIILAAVYGIGFTAMCLKVKEGSYPSPPVPLSGGVGVHPLQAVKSYIYECFSNSYYVKIYAMNALCAMATGVTFFFSVYAARSFGLSLADYGVCTAITYAISFTLSYPFGALADRFHPLRMGLIVLIIHTFVAFWAFLFIDGRLTYAAAFIMEGVLAGCFWTSTSGLLPMLLPKIRFGQISSAGLIVTSIGSMLIGPAIGSFLDCTGHHYEYTFGIAFGLDCLAFLVGISLYRGFIGFGGFKSYVPPEPATISAVATSSSKASE